MAVLESILSVIIVIAVIILGLKILKNIIVTIVLIVILLLVLYYFGYLLSKGKIVGEGTFDELKKNPRFSKMWQKFSKEKRQDRKLMGKQRR